MFRRYLHNFGVQLPCYSPDDNMSVSLPGESDADVLDEQADDDKDDKDDSDDDSKDDDKSDDDESKDDADDDEDKKDDDDKEDEEDEEDKDDDEKDDDDEDEDEDGNKLEVPPSVKEIKAKYPKFFKEFPEVRAAIFREQRFSEMFSNPNEAEISVKKASLLDEIEVDLLEKGDPSNLLAGIAKSNKASFEKLVLNLLPTVQGQDKDLYARVAAIPIKQLLRAALKEGKGSDGKLTDMGKSALWIHKFFFGDEARIEDPVEGEVKPNTEKSEAEKKLEERLRKIDEREFNEFKTSVDNSYITKMTNEFRTVLDKDERLTDFVKRTIIKDGLEEIKNQLEKDARYSRQMTALWNQAVKSGYTSDYKSRIISTALARAKSLVPSIRQKLVSEALGSKKKDTKPEKKVEKKDERRVIKDKSDKPRNFSKPLTDLDILRG